MQVTLVQCSPKLRGEKLRKSVSEWRKWFKESSDVENKSEDNAHHFFDMKGTVHFELIPQSQTVNQAYYVEILKQLHEAVHRKRHELWPNNWIIHHDNTTQKALFAKQFPVPKSITEMKHPPYSLDLAPNDF
jgi:hypothetical protein